MFDRRPAALAPVAPYRQSVPETRKVRAHEIALIAAFPGTRRSVLRFGVTPRVLPRPLLAELRERFGLRRRHKVIGAWAAEVMKQRREGHAALLARMKGILANAQGKLQEKVKQVVAGVREVLGKTGDRVVAELERAAATARPAHGLADDPVTP